MTVRERMLALSIIEKAKKNPVYAQKIGVTAEMKRTNTDEAKKALYFADFVKIGPSIPV